MKAAADEKAPWRDRHDKCEIPQHEDQGYNDQTAETAETRQPDSHPSDCFVRLRGVLRIDPDDLCALVLDLLFDFVDRLALRLDLRNRVSLRAQGVRLTSDLGEQFRLVIRELSNLVLEPRRLGQIADTFLGLVEPVLHLVHEAHDSPLPRLKRTT